MQFQIQNTTFATECLAVYFGGGTAIRIRQILETHQHINYNSMKRLFFVLTIFVNAFFISQLNAQEASRQSMGDEDYYSTKLLFEDCKSFSEGFAAVKDEGEWFFVDRSFHLALLENYNYLVEGGFEDVQPFSEGFAAVKKGGRWGYIDSTGDMFLDNVFDKVRPFNKGYAILYLDGKCGMINTEMNFVVPFDYDNVYLWSDGDVAIVEKNGQYGIYDLSNNSVIFNEYSHNVIAFSEGLAVVSNSRDLLDPNLKNGYIDKTGRLIIPAQFDYANKFSEGLAAVKKGNKWGFINHQGEIVIPCKYDKARDFSDGVAAVKLNNRYGLIDKEGNIVLPFEYEEIGSVKDGVTYFWENGKIGFIDIRGNVIAPAIYDAAAKTFSDGLAGVVKDRKFGFVDRQGNVVVPPIFDYATDYSEGFAVVKKGGRAGFISTNGEVLYDWFNAE